MTSDQEWEEYKSKFNKSYKDDQDEQMRRELYSKVKQKVDEHNTLYDAGEVTYSKNVNQYSDYTPEELSKVDWNVCKAFKRRLDIEDEEPEMPEMDFTNVT